MGSRLASAVGAVVCILWAVAAGQESVPISLVEDWSSKHVIFTNGGRPEVIALAQRDPRNVQQWLHRSRFMFLGRADRQTDNSHADWSDRGFGRPRTDRLAVDWAMPLGPNGGMPVGETPAKFTF